MDPADVARVESAFVAMGTNALPYLAGRITKDPNYTKLEMFRIKHRRQFSGVLQKVWPFPGSKAGEAGDASNLLGGYMKPSGEMLLPLIEPALQSTNVGQRLNGILALRGISSGYELARPYVARGLKDSDAQVQYWSAYAIGQFRGDGKWAVNDLLELSKSTNLDVHRGALAALNNLGTNSWPTLPKLKDMLSEETDEQRRKIIANAIDYISGSR